jgi:hypothetical protein
MILAQSGTIECPNGEDVRIRIPIPSLSGRAPIVQLWGASTTDTDFNISLEMKMNDTHIDNSPIVLGTAVNLGSDEDPLIYDLNDYADFRQVSDVVVLIQKQSVIGDDTVLFELILDQE